MILPTIHLNGSGKAHLVEAQLKVSNALSAAIDALRESAPHGRDYYPQGPGVINQAIEEHCSRLKKLEDLQKEIKAIIHAIA